MAHKETNTRQAGNQEKIVYPTPLLYPDNDDIYNRFHEEQEINPEDITENKEPNKNEKGFDSDELDVPGSELDDAQENIGSEDEENNYYSIGGDDHNNLDEDKAE